MAKGKKMSNRAFGIMWSVIFVVVAAILIAATVVTQIWATAVNKYLGASTSKMVSTTDEEQEDTEYYKSDYDDDASATLSASKELVKEIASEGIVLLENDGALPLSSSAKVSLFSVGSVSPILGGTGSGAVSDEDTVTTKEALEDVGLTVNPELWDFYTDMHENQGYERTYTGVWSSDPWTINEVPVSEFTTSAVSTLSEYGDAAIVFICREGGENEDIPDNSGLDTTTGDVTDSSYTYLTLNETERELFQYLEDSSEVSTIIPIINMNNAFELGWLSDYSKIDACIWAGGLGVTGINALADILVGETNPSGHLVDTYAYDSKSSPAMQNLGNYTYENSDAVPTDICDTSRSTHYITYAEGIYVGYRYYETRYEDVVLGQGSASSDVGLYGSSGSTWNYAEEVQYPFGYGLSYTTFEHSDFTLDYDDGEFTVTVKVTNTGSVAGKDVVEVYFQSPYTDYDKANGVEKASIELCGYAKTSLLAANASETVTVTISEEELRAYDSNGEKGYILDAGDYYFTVATDAHDAINNVLAAKGASSASMSATLNRDNASGNASLADVWTYGGNSTAPNTTIFDTSTTYYGDEGEEITNQLDLADINNYDTTMTYLTRSDWANTFPTTSVLTMNDAIIEGLRSEDYKKDTDDSYEIPTTAAGNGMNLITLRGADYDDENWETLLDNLTGSEMVQLVTQGSFQTVAIESINAPSTAAQDGPAGINGQSIGGAMGNSTAFPAEVLVASTWNEDLLYEMGLQIGNEALITDTSSTNGGLSGLYGPGGNTHRTPYSGRNYEYYSEDPFLAGTMAAVETQGLNDKGVIVYIKHFALNDQEKNRQGLCTWANEQTIREIYLTSFEYAVRFGGSTGIMSAYNRIGPVWIGGCTEVMYNILRDEWGFCGSSITDFVNDTDYQSILQGVNAGNDLWMDSSTTNSLNYSKNGYLLQLLRRASHNILYSVVNSNAMNGMSQATKIVTIMPWWQVTLIVIDCVAGAAIIAGTVLVVIRIRKNKETE